MDYELLRRFDSILAQLREELIQVEQYVKELHDLRDELIRERQSHD